MTILYFADIRFPLERANGIQTMETCWALAERGHRVTLIVRPDTHAPPRDPFTYYGLPRHPLLTIERAPLPARAPAIAARVGYLAFAAGRVIGAVADLIMTRDLGLASMFVRLPARFVRLPARFVRLPARFVRLPARTPLVYESHGYAPEVAAALPQMLSTARPPSRAKIDRLARREARVWRGAAGYVTITAGLADELRQRFGDHQRLAVIPDGVRLPDTMASSVGGTGDRPLVGYAGHLYPWKGVDVLVEALAQVPEVRGLIVGGHEREPDLPRVRALASTLGVNDRITFTGQVAHGDVPALLASASILVLPNPASAISSHATSPLKLFEYMAAGRAIVATDLPSIREVLTDNDTALLVAPGDARAMAAAIGRLAADPSLRTRLGTAARAAAGNYSWNHRAERLEKLFREILDARPAAVHRR